MNGRSSTIFPRKPLGTSELYDGDARLLGVPTLCSRAREVVATVDNVSSLSDFLKANDQSTAESPPPKMTTSLSHIVDIDT